jgi:crotonobetainyl-CoA:carnitine CoA-transferase CaiB-like acyl-CoA transferase
VTVVSLEQAVAAPMATRHLADMGARVIKVERPDGGDFARAYDHTVRGMSSHFVWLNRGKESVALDLKQPASLNVLMRLIERADIFVQNLSQGAAERLGLGAAELRARHPRLITCSISGYGSSGPYRDRKAYDLLIQCEAGVVALTGTEDAPAKVGIAVADIAAAMYAGQGMLMALYHRERTGVGASIEVSLFDSLAEWMGYPAYFTGYGTDAPPRSGAAHATIAPYGPYRVADGTVFLAVQNQPEWASLCRVVVGQPDLARDPRFETNSDRVANRSALDEILDGYFAGQTAAELRQRLDLARIAHAGLNTVREFLDHPQLAARGRWREVGSPVGPLRALEPPIGFDQLEAAMRPIPALGQHTAAILAELGISPPD